MTRPSTLVLVLTGAKTGKTIKLNGHRFIKGELQVCGAAQELQGLITYFGRTYAAFLKGSTQLKEAQVKDAEDGTSEIQEDEGDGQPEPIPSDRESDGGKPTPKTTNDEPGDVGSEGGSTGDISDRDGHSNTGVCSEEDDINQRLLKAITTLNPDNADHWTNDGRPRMDAVETAYGSAGVTRKMVEVTIPGYNRELAAQQKEKACA